MRVVLYTHEFPPFSGGAGTYVATLAYGLSEVHARVQVVAPSYGQDLAEFDKRYPFAVSRMRDWELEPPYCYRAILKALLRCRADTLIVGERVACERIASLSRRFFAYSLVVYGTELWHFFDPAKSTLELSHKRALLDTFTEAEAVIAISEATATLVQAYVPGASERLRVAGCAVDPLQFVPRQDAAAPQARQKGLILSVGRLDTDKGHDVLIKAFALVHKIDPSATLVIVGTGPLEGSLRQLAENLEVSEYVRFAGKVSHTALTLLYETASIFAMPSRSESRFEGFGLVFLEAGLHELPVVGGATGGVPEAIEHGVTGYLVDPYDVDAVASRLRELLADDSLRRRMGDRGHERVLEKFQARALGAQVLAILKEAAAARSLPRRLELKWAMMLELTIRAWSKILHAVSRVISLPSAAL